MEEQGYQVLVRSHVEDTKPQLNTSDGHFGYVKTSTDIEDVGLLEIQTRPILKAMRGAVNA